MKMAVKFPESGSTFGVQMGETYVVGTPGMSAYEVAVDNGFVGTEEEWLESLKGVPGKDGYTPVKGIDYLTEDDKIVRYDEQTLTEEDKAQARENIGITFFGVPYSSATEVIDLSDSVKMHLFATVDGYDAVVTGVGAIPDYTVTVVKPLQFEIETVNRPYDAEKINRLHIGEGITSIGDYFMYKAYHLQHLSFADSTKITHLGKYAFSVTQICGEYDFSGLADTKIDNAFKYCPKLEGLTFGGSITTITESSFRGCLSLRYVKNIAKSGAALTLNNAVFWYCTSLESVDVDPANTTLGKWVFMFVPLEAKTESGVRLDTASWKAQGAMCFVQNEWTQEQLTAIEAVKGNKSIQLTIPKSDTQGTDFNKQYGIFPWPIDGKYQRRVTAASGICGIFTLLHIHNIVYPNRQYNTFYDFIEKGVIPNKIEITQEIYDAYMNDAKGQKLISDLNGIVSYEVGNKVSAVDLLLALSESSSYGDPGTGFWGICEALGWTATENKFKDRDTDTAEDRENCGAVGKQLVLDSLAAGKPVMMEIVGAGGAGHGAHAVVPLGYDAETDKFLIIDSTGAFPANIVPLLYWCKFESLITPDKESAIWTFNFGEEITMANIDNKLDTLLETVNSGFHSVSGLLTVESPVNVGKTAVPYKLENCPAGAKLFALEADESTLAAIKTINDGNYYTINTSSNFSEPITESHRYSSHTVWVGTKQMPAGTSIAMKNDDGVEFGIYTLAAGNYRWTAYYWNE